MLFLEPHQDFQLESTQGAFRKMAAPLTLSKETLKATEIRIKERTLIMKIRKLRKRRSRFAYELYVITTIKNQFFT